MSRSFVPLVHCVIALLGFAGASSFAQLANRPPPPQWLAVEKASGGDAPVIEKRFEWSGKMLKGILLLATESAAEVTINDHSLGRFEPKEQAASIDLTAFVRDGANVLKISTPRSFAALMELNGDLARRQWIASDDSWSSPNGKVTVQAAPVNSGKDPFDLQKTFDAYNSWQLAKPGNQNQATDAATITLPPGFRAELIRSSSGDEGSWIAMTFDPQGRITLSREKRGLLRFDPKTKNVEVINDTLLECRVARP